MSATQDPLPRNLPNASLLVVAASMFIWGLGEGLFIFFLPLALQMWEANAVQIGAVLSLIGVVMALVQAPAGHLSDRFGTRPLILAAMVLGIAAAAVMAAAPSLLLFAAGLVAYGMTSLIRAPINAYITRLRGGWSVQRAVTFVIAALQLGTIFGPVLGGRIAGAAGLSSLFRYAAGLFALSTLVILLAKRAEAEAPSEPAYQQRNLLANPRFLGLLGVVVLTFAALSVPQQLTSLYLQEVHALSIEKIGVLGTVGSAGAAGIMLALGSLPPMAGMLAGQLLIAGFALLLWLGQGMAAFAAGYFLIGGYRLYGAMALAHARALVPARQIGLAYGLVETGNALAVIAAPLLAGALYSLQPNAVYTASLAALALTILLNIRLGKIKTE